MNRTSGRSLAALVLLALCVSLWSPDAAFAQKGEKAWAVPVVMEEATVRGKVVILETRTQDRRTVSGLRIEVWEPEQDNPSIRRKLLHKTTTDEDGLYSLPRLEAGQYILMVSDLRLSLTVIPKEQGQAGQEEPKIMLILLPKDVI